MSCGRFVAQAFGGDINAQSGNLGFEAMDDSYFSFSAQYRDCQQTNRGDINPRVVNPANIDPDQGDVP
jgi:hypothetical protein